MPVFQNAISCKAVPIVPHDRTTAMSEFFSQKADICGGELDPVLTPLKTHLGSVHAPHADVDRFSFQTYVKLDFVSCYWFYES